MRGGHANSTTYLWLCSGLGESSILSSYFLDFVTSQKLVFAVGANPRQFSLQRFAGGRTDAPGRPRSCQARV